MKQLSKYVCALALITTPLLAQASHKSHTLEECSTFVAFEDLTPEMSRQLFWGELPNMAIEVKAGSEFPAAFFVKYGFFSATQNAAFTINVDRTCYFRFINSGTDEIRACISFDLVKWRKSKPQPKGDMILNADANTLQVAVDVSKD